MAKVPRAKIAQAVAAGKFTPRDIAAYLLDTHRTRDLDSLLRDISVVRAANGHVEAVARTAHPLDASARETITKRVKQLYTDAKTVIITEVADPSILGGVQISVANQQLDLSVEAKINKLRQLTEVK